MMEDKNQNQPLLHPFLPSTTTTATSSPPHFSLDGSYGIILRLAMLICIGIISLYTNHEASKGFSISVVNEAADQPLGKRFDLFYVSNDGASRLLLTTSKFVEDFLYLDSSFPKKQVSSVTLRLSSRNLTQLVIVESGEVNDQFVIHISPSVLEEYDFKKAMSVAMQNGIVRLWLSGGFSDAPLELVNDIIEYVRELAVTGGGSWRMSETVAGDMHCWKRWLNYWEMDKPGFIRRLNRSMRNGWHDRMVDDVMGVHVHNDCHAHNSSGFI